MIIITFDFVCLAANGPAYQDKLDVNYTEKLRRWLTTILFSISLAEAGARSVVFYAKFKLVRCPSLFSVNCTNLMNL